MGSYETINVIPAFDINLHRLPFGHWGISATRASDGQRVISFFGYADQSQANELVREYREHNGIPVDFFYSRTHSMSDRCII